MRERPERLQMRLRAVELRAIRRAAKAARLRPSTWVRHVALNATLKPETLETKWFGAGQPPTVE